MAAQRRTDGFQQRLARALTEGPRPTSTRGLATKLQGAYPGLRGASASGVQHYVTAKNFRSPRPEVLRAMADVLGVRWEWLSFNEGAMTEREEAERLFAEGIADQPLAADYREAQERRDALESELNAALKAAFRGRVISPVARAVFVHSLKCVNADPAIVSQTSAPLAAARFAAALAAGLDRLRVGEPNSDTLETYIIEAAPTLARAALKTWTENLNRPARREAGEGVKPNPTGKKGRRSTKTRSTKKEA